MIFSAIIYPQPACFGKIMPKIVGVQFFERQCSADVNQETELTEAWKHITSVRQQKQNLLLIDKINKATLQTKQMSITACTNPSFESLFSLVYNMISYLSLQL